MGAKLNRGGSRQDYQTPQVFIEAVKQKLGIERFMADLAADEFNKQAEFYLDLEMDSLIQPWEKIGGWMWCNPPFNDIAPWVAKAAESSARGASIAMLVPASTGANWWRDYVHDIAHILLLNGRLTFVGESDPYPKDCALLLYTKYTLGGYEVWNWRK